MSSPRPTFFLSPLLRLFCVFLFPVATVHAAEDGQVIFLGSSTMEFWRGYLPKHFPGMDVNDLGVGGTQYSYLVEHASAWADQYPHARKVVIYSGDNDVTWGKSPEQVVADFQRAVEILHSRMKYAEFHVISTKPSPDPERAVKIPVIDRANDLIEKKSKELGYVHYLEVNIAMRGVDGKPLKELFGPDNIHMNDEGYALWRNLLAPVISRCKDEELSSWRIENNISAMYRLHEKTRAVAGTISQARSLLSGIRGEVKKACELQAKAAAEVETAAKSTVNEAEAQDGSFNAAVKLVVQTQEKISRLRKQVQQSYSKQSKLVTQFGARSLMQAESAGGEQLAREAKGGRRHVSSSARRLLSVDQDMSVDSDRLGELAAKYVEAWEKLGGGAELVKARAAMDRAKKTRDDLDHSRELLMRR